MPGTPSYDRCGCQPTEKQPVKRRSRRSTTNADEAKPEAGADQDDDKEDGDEAEKADGDEAEEAGEKADDPE